MEELIILGGFLIFYGIEVFHDYILEQVRNKKRAVLKAWRDSDPSGVIDISRDLDQDQKWSDQWHRLDWFGHVLLAALISYLIYLRSGSWGSWALMLAMGSLRIIVLNIGLNMRRGKKGKELLYLSSKGLEGRFKKREIVYFLLVFLLLLGSLFMIYYGKL